MSLQFPASLIPLQAKLQIHFSVPLTLVCTEAELDLSALSPLEQKRYAALASASRRSAWLKGRAALKELMQYLQLSPETATLTFPHPHLSLTHSGQYALAVGCHASLQILGLGIDYEAHRSPSVKSTRFFLRDSETAWLEAYPELQRADARLRLWTVKEAIFKADPINAEKRYLDYQLADPALVEGNASSQDERALMFQYCSLKALDGWISIAVLPSFL